MSQVIPFEGRSRSLEPRPPRQARYLVVHLFAFALERCGYVDSEPAVLCTFRRNALRVIAMMSAARHSGVRLGMSVSAARALCQNLLWKCGVKEKRSRLEFPREYLVSIYRSYTAGMGYRCCLREVSQSSHLFGGESALIQDIMNRMHEMGHASCVAVADDPLAAQYGPAVRALAWFL